MQKFGLERNSTGKHVIKYGEPGGFFYIILLGKVSVWEPVKAFTMLKPLQKLKKRVQSAIATQMEKLEGFKFYF